MKNQLTLNIPEAENSSLNKQFSRIRPSEASLLSLTLLIFVAFPWLVRWIDAGAAPVDPGALSMILMALLAFLTFKAATWWLIRIIWPVFAEYSSQHFERNFKSLLSWQKVLIYLGFYLLLLFGFVFTLVAVM